MSEHEHGHEGHTHHEEHRPRWRLPTNWVLIGFLVVAGYFLVTEHRAHVVPYLPYALLLACPLMHLFHGHGGHGGHGRGEGGDSGKPGGSRPKDQGGRE